MQRNRYRFIRLPLGLALLLAPVPAFATDLLIESATTTSQAVTTGNTLTVTDSGSITINGNAITVSGTVASVTNEGALSGGSSSAHTGVGVYVNAGSTLTNLYNYGSMAMGQDGVHNSGTITNFYNFGTMSGAGGNPVFNNGSIVNMTNAQSSGFLVNYYTPTNYYTYFNADGTYGKVTFATIGSTLAHYGVSNVAMAGTYAGVVSSSSTFTISNQLAADGVTYSLTTSDGGLTYDLVVSDVTKWSANGSAIGENEHSLGLALDEQVYGSSMTQAMYGLNALSGSAYVRGMKQLEASKLPAQVLSTGLLYDLPSEQIEGHSLALLDGVIAPAGSGAGQQSAFWGQAIGGSEGLASTSLSDGMVASTVGFVMGADMVVSKEASAGVAFNMLRTSADGRDNLSTSDLSVNSFQLSGYGTYRPDQGPWYVQGLVGVGLNAFDQHRVVDYLAEKATASYTGYQTQLRATTGYDFVLQDDLKLTPYLSLHAAWSHNPDYDETGSSTNQSVKETTVRSFDSTFGGKIAQRFQTDFGSVGAEVKLGWRHDFAQDAIATSATINGYSYTVKTDRPSADGAQIGLGLTWQQDDNVTVRLGYEGDIRAGYGSHTGLVGASVKF